MKILVPTDGSEASLAAVRYLIGETPWRDAQPELHLINVQPAVRSDVGQFVGNERIREYQQDEGLKALAPARAALDQATRRYEYHVLAGEDAAALIVRFAREGSFDLIVIGKRGHGALSGVLLGSVAAGVARTASVPALLVQ